MKPLACLLGHVGPGSFVFVFLAFFQFAGGILLWYVRPEPVRPVRALALLLAMNGFVTGATALGREGFFPALTQQLLLAADASTVGLLLLFMLEQRGEDRPLARRCAWALVVAQVAVTLAFPPVTVGLLDFVFRALPYFVMLGWMALALSRGEAWMRWVCLAFLPRALVFGFVALLSIPFPGADAATLLYQVSALGLLVVGLVGAFRLLRGPTEGPRPAVILPVLGATPVLAVLTVAGGLGVVGAHLLNFLTLALVRPLFLYLGLARPYLLSTLGRSVVTSAVAIAAALLADAGLDASPGASMALGMALGAFTYGAIEAWRPLVSSLPTRSAGPPGHAASSPSDLPQWQRLLVALRGSSTGVAEPADPRWTQKMLSAATGISVKRVSGFPEDLQATAVAKLDRYLPGWREGGTDPTLVTTHRGAVRGHPGIWVYYRLTPLGERLAAALPVDHWPFDGPVGAESARTPPPP